MDWVKDGERAYRNGDKRLIKHTCTFRMDLGDPRSVLTSEVKWKLGHIDGDQPQGSDDFKLTPSAPKNSRFIESTAALDSRITIIGGDERTWSTIDVALYRATGDLKAVDLQKPDIEIQPQVLWHDAGGEEPKRPPKLMLVLSLPPEIFDPLEQHLLRKATAKIALLVAIDVFENAEHYSWMSAFGSRAYYIASGSSNAAVFEEYRVTPPAGSSPGAEERMREAADEEIAAYLKQYCEERDIEPNRFGQTGSLLSGLCRAAAVHEAALGTSVEEFRRRTFRAVAALVDGLRDAVTPYAEREKGKLDFWSRPRQPFFELRRDKKAPEIDRIAIEEMADRYLRLPYRSAEFDRLLADMLAAAEMYAYGETVVVKNPVAWVFGMSPSPLHPRPIRNWLIGQLWNLVVFGIPAAIAYYIGAKGWIGTDAIAWTMAGCLILFGLLFAISLAALPFFIYRGAREKASTLNRLNAMQTVYSAIEARSLISARHIKQRLEAAADHDVIWPGILYVLIEDIAARGGRF